jgi:surface protein
MGHLTELNLSNFDTSNVTDMSGMFYACEELTTIYVGDKWVINEDTDVTDMFTGCGCSSVTYV